MRRLALFIACSLVLAGCGGSNDRMAAFICENIPPEGEIWEDGEELTLDGLKAKLKDSESLSAFHKEALPWIYDRETGDLYEYDDFEESFVPIKELDYAPDGQNKYRYWTEFSGILSRNGTKLKIKMTEKSWYPRRGESVKDVNYEVFDIERNNVVFNPGEDDERTAKCIDVPTTGIDVHWAETK